MATSGPIAMGIPQVPSLRGEHLPLNLHHPGLGRSLRRSISGNHKCLFPPSYPEWYFRHMSAPVLEPRSYPLTVGDKGRLVIPAEIRAAHGWSTGTAVIAVDAPGGVLLLTVDEAMKHVRSVSRVSVDDVLAGRRAERVAEDQELVGWGASSLTPQQ